MKNQIIIWKRDYLYYTTGLNNIMIKIRIIDNVSKEIKLGLWDSNIKYRSFHDQKFTDLQSNYYTDRGKWLDFILSTETFKNENIKIINPFTIEEIISSKLRLTLLLFWRDILNKLSSVTFFLNYN